MLTEAIRTGRETMNFSLTADCFSRELKCDFVKRLQIPDRGNVLMEINVEEYYRKYGPMVYRRCMFLLRDENRAFDAMQDVFVRLLNYKDRLVHQYPSSLLYRIATNICLNIIKSEKKYADVDPEALLPMIASCEGEEKRLFARDFLDKVFRDEKPDTREIAVMFFIDKMKLREISEQTGLSVSGLRKRLGKLRQIALFYREEYDHE